MAVDRDEPPLGPGCEQLRGQRLQQRVPVVPVVGGAWVGRALVGVQIVAVRVTRVGREAGAAGDEEHRAQTPGGVQRSLHFGRRPGGPVFLVVLGGQLPARFLEGLPPALRPGPVLRDDARQQAQTLRIAQQSIETARSGFADEGIGVGDARPRGQHCLGILVRQRVEPQDRYLRALRRDGSKMLAVVRAQPIGRAAGQAEGRSSELVELPANLVERRALVLRSGAAFVQAVDEQRLAAPFGMIVRCEGKEVPRRHVHRRVAQRRALALEGGGLAGAGIAQQHVGGGGAEALQGLTGIGRTA